VQIFFATTQLKKDFGIPNPPPALEVRRLGIVGSGFMGAGIAATAAVQAGVDVRMRDTDLERVATGLRSAREVLDERLKRRRITRHEYARQVMLLSGGSDYQGLPSRPRHRGRVRRPRSSIVVSEVEGRTHDRAVFASTLTIPIAHIAATARRRARDRHALLLPVPRMPLLEVIPSDAPTPRSSAPPWRSGVYGQTVIVVAGPASSIAFAPYINEAAPDSGGRNNWTIDEQWCSGAFCRTDHADRRRHRCGRKAGRDACALVT
jgi:3-hydroxyacyl-CoA dehydrogenase/enoyl-CoA hydratase/3-hydroxybutyryl-CoA epimerase